MYMDNQTIKAWQSDRREPCRAYLSPAYTVRLVEADIGMPGLKDAVLFPSGLIDHVAEAEKMICHKSYNFIKKQLEQ